MERGGGMDGERERGRLGERERGEMSKSKRNVSGDPSVNSKTTHKSRR